MTQFLGFRFRSLNFGSSDFVQNFALIEIPFLSFIQNKFSFEPAIFEKREKSPLGFWGKCSKNLFQGQKKRIFV